MFDDWFNQKIGINHGPNDEHNFKRDVHIRTIESKTIEVIRAYGSDGISHLQLAQIVKIDRKNLTKYTKKLIKKGLIKKGRGKQGKYYPNDKRYRGTAFSADILSKVAAGIILADEDFPIDSPFFTGELRHTLLEIVLFMFSNKVGAIITYLVIQSMNKANRITGYTDSDEEKDLNVQWWLEDAVSSLQEVLVPIFKEFVSPSLRTFQDDFIHKDGSVDRSGAGLAVLSYLYNRPPFTNSERVTSELLSAFSRTYPSIANKLEIIMSQLPQAVARKVNHWEYEAYSFNHQKICAHDFKPPSNKMLAAQRNDNILHCPRCHKTKYKKNPFLKKSAVSFGL